MAAAKQLVKAKKNWYPIVAPQGFNEMLLGESPVSELDSLKGRCITVNLMTITNDPKHQNISIFFRISGTADGKALTEICGYETSQSALKRFVRRDVNRLDDSFVCETSDKRQIRVKVMLLTRTKTTSSILKSLRAAMLNSIASEAASQDFETFLKNVIYYKIQGALRDSLKKIYPVRGFEVKRVELLKRPAVRVVRPKIEKKEQNPKKAADEAREE